MMKLRKALDRAKDARERRANLQMGNISVFRDPSISSIPFGGIKNVLEKDHDRDHIDESDDPKEAMWQKPVYSRSQTVKIDPEIVAANRGVCIDPNALEIQRYKILRTRIQQRSSDRSLNTIMITSANKREGKTVNAINMAFTFARGMNQTVLLVDCDFTGQDIHRYLGVDNQLSLIDYFNEGKPLDELIIWPGIDQLTLISGNRTVLDGSELLSSSAMKNLVMEMKSRYDDRYVLFDAPPVLEHAEAISMAPFMDGILMVVEAGVTPEKDVKKAISMLPAEKFLGFVLNKQNG